jgi:hypothetical protein
MLHFSYYVGSEALGYDVVMPLPTPDSARNVDSTRTFIKKSILEDPYPNVDGLRRRSSDSGDRARKKQKL